MKKFPRRLCRPAIASSSQAGQIIPGDGEIIEGVASVDESAITGESAPVIREAGGDRSGVTGGTGVLSDRIVVEITAAPGESFLDRMIALVEGAIRQRTPNEIALSLVLSAFTLIFLIVTDSALADGVQRRAVHEETTWASRNPCRSLGTDVPTLVALLVCLIPTTIGALLGGHRHRGHGPRPAGQHHRQERQGGRSGRRRRYVLLDKTGTITIGNRQATTFVPVGDVFARAKLGGLAALASAADADARRQEHRGVVRGKQSQIIRCSDAATRRLVTVRAVHGANADERHRPARRSANPQRSAGRGHQIRRRERHGSVPAELNRLVDARCLQRGNAAGRCEGGRIAGLVVLEDILKPGICRSGSSGCGGWACGR